jgi:3',5'-cyclic AMP phosphodiesterase CpdA
VVLNSNLRHDDQAVWLERVLSGPRPRWTVVAFHHPLFAASKLRDNLLQREAWQPVFERCGVDLALQGHDHVYARSGLISGPNVAEGAPRRMDQGTVYVVSVSGPKMYPHPRPLRPEFVRAAEDTQLFQVITIADATLTFTARTATGRRYDGFTLTKSPEGRNQLVDDIPAGPPRLRP